MANETSPAPKSGKLLRSIFIWLLVILAVGIAATLFVFNFTYSEGNMAGTVIRFSKKGYVFKTYEGEMNLGGMNNINNNTVQVNSLWYFSVKDEATAQKLIKLQGKKVSVHYSEVIKQMPWQGETKYFVDGVEAIE